MARHRSDAPLAPRPAPNVPVDPFGDLVDVPRGGGLAAPPAPPSPPFGLPTLATEGPSFSSFGLPATELSGPVGLLEAPSTPDPTVRALGADRAPGSVPAPWTGPTRRPVPPATGSDPRVGTTGAATAVDPSWSPAVPAPRAGDGRHAWVVEPDDPAGPDQQVPALAARPATRHGRSGRGPRGTGGHDPETTPLDLAAIALACARTATGSHRFEGTGGLPSLTGSGRLPIPAAPTTGGHRAADRGGPRGLSPTRTAGALAVAGALVSAGVAVLGSGSMLASAESPRTAAEASAAVSHAPGGR